MAGMFIHPDAVPQKYKHLHVSYVENGGDVLTGDTMLAAYKLLVGDSGIKNMDWFPVTGAPESLKGFPRTYITNTDKEALRDDGTVLEAALRDAGVAVKRDNMPALPHYFWRFPIEKAGARFREILVEGTKWVVGPL